MARSLFCSELVVPVNGTGVSVVGANPNRSLIIFQGGQNTGVWVTTQSVAAVGKGFRLAADGLSLAIDPYHFGNMPSQAWRAITELGNDSITVWIGEFDPARLREFEQAYRNGA